MVLANLGVNVRYRRLLNLLKVRRGAGASFYNLRFLDALGVSVVMEDGHMGMLEGLLARNTPVIVAVNTVDLSYWQGEAVDHAVVAAGCDDAVVELHDP